MLTSWKTTLAGLAGGLLVILNNAANQHLSWHDWAQALAIALVGLFAKDHNVTGGSTHQ